MSVPGVRPRTAAPWLPRAARPLAAALLVAAAALAPAVGQASASAAPARAARSTRVEVFVPSTFRADQYATGYCWVGSIASNRPDAYRCMSGNAIHDPCFAFGGGTAVECPTDPATGRAVYLALTKPLPAANALPKPGAAIRPWYGTLAGGAHCGVITGTSMFGRPFSCGLPGKGGALTPIYCTWPAAVRGDPSLYTSRCATGTVGSKGPVLGRDRTYDLATMWL